jgi:hypothetical protein
VPGVSLIMQSFPVAHKNFVRNSATMKDMNEEYKSYWSDCGKIF